MILEDDSNFKKSKRAVSITASIALFMIITDLPLEDVNFGVVKFNLKGSLGIYWFLFGILVYQIFIFRLRFLEEKERIRLMMKNHELNAADRSRLEPIFAKEKFYDFKIPFGFAILVAFILLLFLLICKVDLLK